MNRLELSVITEKLEGILSAFVETFNRLLELCQFFVNTPESLGGFICINQQPAGTGKLRLSLDPTNRCIDLLSALRAVERNLSAIQVAYHSTPPKVSRHATVVANNTMKTGRERTKKKAK